MSVPKFTPGPWTAYPVREGNGDYRIAAGDQRIAAAFELYSQGDTKSNAALIAAAPELYAALAEAEWQVSRHSNGLNQACEQWLAKARAALAKARGE